jgi:hypothetical protein
LLGAGDGGRLRSWAEIGYAAPDVAITAFGFSINGLDRFFRTCKTATKAVILVLFFIEKHVHINVPPETQRTSVV